MLLNTHMGLAKQTDFSDFLNNEFSLRQKKNSKYSLRMFAKFLNIDSSRLSKILKKQRPVSEELIQQLGVRLQLSPKKIEVFISGTKKPYDKKNEMMAIPIEQHYQLRLDQITLISEWQHYALLELMKHENFRTDKKWIAEQLGQPPEVIELVIQRLERVGLLKITDKGEWHDQSEGYSTHVLGENLTSNAHRNYQAQVLELSKQALFRTNIHNRDHSTIVV
ncbi:MAG: TIGR02147 family protein, partial [Bdellovibrionaceae bacterium]|nr:TIGR02147 family protein [Bdellovibrio sp.]